MIPAQQTEFPHALADRESTLFASRQWPVAIQILLYMSECENSISVDKAREFSWFFMISIFHSQVI